MLALLAFAVGANLIASHKRRLLYPPTSRATTSKLPRMKSPPAPI